MPVHFFNRQQLPATPWKNGGGVTREIVCQPPGAGMDAFDWRVSIAHIASDGPFSRFAQVDRVITLLEGAGVRLRSSDGALDHRLDRPWEPYAFAGEAPVVGELIAGDCHDFNVMVRRGRFRARVVVYREAATLPVTGAGLLMALAGRWRVMNTQSDAWTLMANHGLWWQDGGGPVDLQPEMEDASSSSPAALLAVSIEGERA